uniref:Putative secreted protein n=1 Tax=Ixodes ricinus TaxID=34613 RepID=V5HBK4_IXORI
MKVALLLLLVAAVFIIGVQSTSPPICTNVNCADQHCNPVSCTCGSYKGSCGCCDVCYKCAKSPPSLYYFYHGVFSRGVVVPNVANDCNSILRIANNLPYGRPTGTTVLSSPTVTRRPTHRYTPHHLVSKNRVV